MTRAAQSESASHTWLHANDQNVSSKLMMTLGLTMLGKLLGFVRLQQIAVLLGISLYSDVVFIVLQLVWLVETVVISGAAVPVLIARIYKIDTDEGAAAASTFFLHTALLCSGLALIFGVGAAFFYEPLASLVAPGLEDEGRVLFGELLFLSAATPMALAFSQFLGLINRLLQNGVWYSLTQVVTNSASILGLIVGYALGGAATAVAAMVIGLLIGCLGIACIQFLVIPRAARIPPTQAVRQQPRNILLYPGASYWSGVSVLMLATFVNEAYIYVDFYFGSQLEAGSVSAIGFASRLATLTNMLFITTAFVVLEPRWAKALSSEASDAWNKVINLDATRLIALLAAPVSLLSVFASEINDLVYRSGSYAPSDQARLDALTEIFAWALLAMGITFISARALIVAGLQRWITGITVAVLPLKVAMNAFFLPIYGAPGLALATTLSFGLQALGNLIGLKRASLPLPMSNIKNIGRLAGCFLATYGTALILHASLPSTHTALCFAVLIVGAVNFGIGSVCGLQYLNFVKIVTRRR